MYQKVLKLLTENNNYEKRNKEQSKRYIFTNSSLQERYPNIYNNIGFSDFEIELNEKIIKIKKKRIAF